MDKLISLRFAINGGENEVAKSLINELGVEAIYNGGTPLNYAVLSGNREIFDYLLEKNADVNALYGGNISPLMSAAENGNMYMASALLAKGANINYVDKNGNNALSRATERHGASHEFMKLFLDHGADPFEKFNGESAMDIARDILGDEELVALFEQYKDTGRN